MSRLHNLHPSEVIRVFLGEVTILDAATLLGVDNVTQVITRAAGISHDMALRLEDVFGKRTDLVSFAKVDNEN